MKKTKKIIEMMAFSVVEKKYEAREIFLELEEKLKCLSPALIFFQELIFLR